MPQDVTAIAIVSISAGATVALGGGALNAWLARKQAERQFSHEREMADLVELRNFLERALTTVQDVIDCILGISADLGDTSGVPLDSLAEALRAAAPRWRRWRIRTDGLNARFSNSLTNQIQGIVELSDQLKAPVVGLIMRVGAEHPLATSFRRLINLTLAAVDAIPDTWPPAEAALASFVERWERMGNAHGAFLELAADYVGVDLDARKSALRVGRAGERTHDPTTEQPSSPV